MGVGYADTASLLAHRAETTDQTRGFAAMDTLPPQLPPDGREAVTGVICPDCGGAVTIQRHHRHVVFACRVGHAYSVAELVVAKEQELERRLWMVNYSFEELAALLSDCERLGLAQELDTEPCRRRISAAREQAARVRAMIEADRPLFAMTGDEQDVNLPGIAT